MSNDGPNILQLFQQTRKICEDVALLLRTQEEQMSSKGWETDRSTAVCDSSSSIHNPWGWIPINAFRFYVNDKHPNVLAFISVLLDDHWDNLYSIKEPIITAGFFDYGNKKWDTFDYSFSRVYGYLFKKHNWEPNGELFSFDRSMLSSNHRGDFINGKVFALPLVSIKNEKQIETKITDKLLRFVDTKV